MQDKELVILAQRLYEKYKEAFDFIEDNRPRPESMLDLVRAEVGQSEVFVPDASGSSV